MNKLLSATIGAAGAACLIQGAALAQQITLQVSGGNPAIASYYQLGNCLDFNAAGVAMHMPCTASSGTQQLRFASGSYGQLTTAGRCLTSGTAPGPLTLQPCTNATNQRWGFQPDGSLRNELGFCADIEGGNRSAGGRVVGWSCSGSMNQKWYVATSGANVRMTQIPSNLYSGSIAGSALISSRGVSTSNIVAGGAGNIVAGGAGNIIAASVVAGGAGNIVAAGAGNIVAGGAGNIVAGGAGNLLANDGGGLRPVPARGY